MWPFSSKPDTRPATEAARTISVSLTTEPERWRLGNRASDVLVHDSGITINTCGFIIDPDLDDEPDANGELVAAAIDKWVAKMVAMPARPKEPEPAVKD